MISYSVANLNYRIVKCCLRKLLIRNLPNDNSVCLGRLGCFECKYRKW